MVVCTRLPFTTVPPPPGDALNPRMEISFTRPFSPSAFKSFFDDGWFCAIDDRDKQMNNNITEINLMNGLMLLLGGTFYFALANYGKVMF